MQKILDGECKSGRRGRAERSAKIVQGHVGDSCHVMVGRHDVLHAQYPECSLADVRSWYRGLVILGYTIALLILRGDYGKSRECTSAASR
jgi:hypothetical protein